STATIPSRLNISTQTRSSISTARISRNISRTSISARVPSTTPPSTLLAQLWSKWSSESALPKVPEAQLQCSDAICSNLSPPNLKCMNRIPDLVKRMAAPTCRFQKGESKPKYLLRSFPGSGNTWVRQVLEKATGICTGSIYCDSDIMLSGMIGEGVDSSSVLVVKTHNPKTPGNATIFIVRNPINAIVSFWKWQLIYTRMYKTEEKIHVANPPVRYFRNNPRWNNSIRGEVNYWTNLIKGTLSKTNKPLLIVTYEDIKSNTTREVFRMLDFLNVEYSAEEIIEKFKDDQLTMFKRPKVRDFDPYTPPQRDRVRIRLKQLSTSLHHKTMVEIIKRYLLEL
ncbi:WSCD family member CG9164, partial [Geodia barretti]